MGEAKGSRQNKDDYHKKKKKNSLMVKFLPLPYTDSTPSSDCKSVRGNSYHHSNSVATDNWFSRSEREVKSVSQPVL